MNNTDRHPECHMRTALGNCDPIGGFCTSVNEPICEALHKVSRPQGEWKHLKGDEWLCSNCGYVVWTEGSWEHPIERGKDYCEHCGARMKGVDNETD